MNVGWLVNPSHMDLLLTLTSLSDIVRRMHSHERVHLDSKGFLDVACKAPDSVSSPKAIAVRNRVLDLILVMEAIEKIVK